MEAKFIYKGMDLTLDYYEKVRKVVASIADQEKKILMNAMKYSQGLRHMKHCVNPSLLCGLKAWDSSLMNFIGKREKIEAYENSRILYTKGIWRDPGAFLVVSGKE